MSIYNISNRTEGMRGRLSGETASVHTIAWSIDGHLSETLERSGKHSKLALPRGGGEVEEEGRRSPYLVGNFTCRQWGKAIDAGHGEPSVPLIGKVLHEDKTRVVKAAAYALMLVGEPSVEELKMAVTEGTDNLQSAAAHALARMGDPGKEALADIMRFSQSGRVIAARALVEEVGEAALPALYVLSEDDDTRVSIVAIKALHQIGSQESINHLETLLEKRDWRVKEAVKNAIDAIKEKQEG